MIEEVYMTVNYYAGATEPKAFELAELIIEAYKLYNYSKSGQVIPPTITLGTSVYAIQHLLHGKALLIDTFKLLGFLAVNNNEASLIFRGTSTMSEWICDGEIHQVNYAPGWGKVHSGFHEIYKSFSTDLIKAVNALPSTVTSLHVGGHSLGGAVSTLAMVDLIDETRFKAPLHYTYCSPRVGDPEFFEKFQSSISSSYRIHNTEDIVPTKPDAVSLVSIGVGSLYTHVGNPIPYTHPGASIGENHLLETCMNYLK